MIRLALVEDDELYRSQLREYIDKYSAASGEKFTVTEFSDGDDRIIIRLSMTSS